MCGGWTPSVSLFSHTKGALAWDDEAQAFVPGATAEACAVAGAGRGAWGVARALSDGAAAGARAADLRGGSGLMPS
jgi:sarcosine oxidase, subunit alpha